jgi:hypothetical protein
MYAKFINDGQPESGEFDENYSTFRDPHAEAPARAWRELKVTREVRNRIVAPKDVRFFQWMEKSGSGISND